MGETIRVKRMARRRVGTPKGGEEGGVAAGDLENPSAAIPTTGKKSRAVSCSRRFPASKFLPLAKITLGVLILSVAFWLALELVALRSVAGGVGSMRRFSAASSQKSTAKRAVAASPQHQLMVAACERRGHPDAFSLSPDDLRNTLIGELESILGVDIRVIQKADTRHIALLAVVSMMSPLQRYLFASDPTGDGAPLEMVIDPEKLRNAAIARLSQNPDIGLRVQELQKLDTKDLYDIIDDALKVSAVSCCRMHRARLLRLTHDPRFT